MVELKGYYNENVLQELLDDNKISSLEYIYHHSEDKIDKFRGFCQCNNIPEDEHSAVLFLI